MDPVPGGVRRLTLAVHAVACLLAIAPVILTWIVARGHSLSWRPGEVTMVAGMIGVTLVLCNGIILGKPEPCAHFIHRFLTARQDRFLFR